VDSFPVNTKNNENAQTFKGGLMLLRDNVHKHLPFSPDHSAQRVIKPWGLK